MYGPLCFGGISGPCGGISGPCIIHDDGSPAFGERPYQGSDPADQGPSQKEIKCEDTSGTAVIADHCDDRRQEIGKEHEDKDDPSECSGHKGEETKKGQLYHIKRVGLMNIQTIIVIVNAL